MSEDKNLVSDIQNSENYEQKNNAEVYTADNGTKVNIMDQAGADFVTDALGGHGSITKGPNIVEQQPPHGEDNPKYKSMGGNAPSLPTTPGESFNDKDYRNPENRNNSNYGPVVTTPEMSDYLGRQDKAKELSVEDRHKAEMEDYNNKYNKGMTNTSKFGESDAIARQEELKKDQTNETPKKPFFDLEFGSDEEVKKRDLHQEALDSNKKANEGFDPEKKLSNTGRTFFEREDIYAKNASLEEQNKMLIERLDRMQATLDRLTGTYEQDPALSAALDPNRPKSKDQLEVDQAYATINKDLNQKALDEMAQVKAMLEPKPPVLVPEAPPPIPEIGTTPEVQKKQRDFKTAALIAGVVAGGAAGILGGTAVGIPVAAAAGVISIGGRISNYFLGRSLNKIAAQIEDPTLDPTTKERLLKRETNLKKIQNIVQHVTKFATGAAIGAGIANFISHAAMGGHGLVWNRPEVPEIPGGVPGAAEGNLGNTGIEQNPATPTGEGSLSGSPETYPGNSFIKDGRINLPGDAIDGTMAQAPYEGAMPQSEISANLFAGGNHNKAAWEIGEWLKANNITDSQLNNLTQYDKHRLFYDNVLRTQAGQSVDPIAVLQNLGTPGAQEFLKVIPVK